MLDPHSESATHVLLGLHARALHSKHTYRLALPPPRGNTSLSDHGESTQATNLAAELAAGSQTSSYNFGRAQQGGKRGADAATVVWRECW